MLARKFSSGQAPFPQMRWVSGSHLCGNKRSRSFSGGESKALHPSSEPGYKARYRSSVHRIFVRARSEVEASKISRYPCHLARQLRDFWARGNNFCQPWVGMLRYSASTCPEPCPQRAGMSHGRNLTPRWILAAPAAGCVPLYMLSIILPEYSHYLKNGDKIPIWPNTFYLSWASWSKIRTVSGARGHLLKPQSRGAREPGIPPVKPPEIWARLPPPSSLSCLFSPDLLHFSSSEDAPPLFLVPVAKAGCPHSPLISVCVTVPTSFSLAAVFQSHSKLPGESGPAGLKLYHSGLWHSELCPAKGAI